MAVGTVSTYAIFQSTLNDVNKVETNLTTEQEQLSSGNQYQDFTGMANQTQQYLSLNATISRNTQYLNNNKVIEASVNTTSSVLGQVISTADSLQSLISQRRTGVSDNAAFQSQLEGIWQQLAGQLNTSINNQYLFSGTKTNTPAVDPTQFPTTVAPGVPDDSYYQGSDQDITARADDNTSITYNVRGNAMGFQEIIAGLSLASQAGQDNSDSDFQQSLDLVQKGLQDVTTLQATANANTVQYSTIDTNLTNTNLYWQGLQQSIGNTDIVSVSTQVAVNQGILQAAFQAFAKISSLQLSNYLK